jgi:Flp pilus assembly protein TadG
VIFARTRRDPRSPTAVAGRRRLRRGHGQGLVEFAVVLPVFMLLLFGLIDGGRLVYLSSTLSQAAREGARLGSVEAGWIASTDAGCGQVGGPTCPADLAALRADVRTAVNRMITPFASIPSADVFLSCETSTPPTGSWTGQTCTSRTSGSVLSVRVVYTYTAMTPLLGQILGSVVLSGAATMVIN